MDKILMQKQIAAAILGQDQLVFTYKKDKVDATTGQTDTRIVVRYVTPIELDIGIVKCVQHLPEAGYRNFKLDKIVDFHRVITRSAPISEIKDAKKDAAKAAPATPAVLGVSN